MAQLVQLARGCARFDERGDVIQDFGRKPAGHAHLRNVFGGMNGNGHAVTLSARKRTKRRVVSKAWIIAPKRPGRVFWAPGAGLGSFAVNAWKVLS
ncbi:hypothetical protein MMB19_15850 [Ralstonia insidiosa]|nr:hypothetical protein MMB19_15850 [Ralstonia insidiosa]